MTDPIDLSLRAASLWLRAASLGVKAAAIPLEATARVVGARRPGPTPPPATPGPTPPPATPSPKQRRRSARGEPTPGQAARRRGAQRRAETAAARQTDAAPHVGAEVQVAEPWDGYAGMTVADVLQRLADADDTTRAAVRLYEHAHERREAVLHVTEAQ
jgi:hypothetical protein